MKLHEFRVESYDERQVLIVALLKYQAELPDMYPETIDTLLVRLTKTECQPGGCSICNPDYKEEWR